MPGGQIINHEGYCYAVANCEACDAPFDEDGVLAVECEHSGTKMWKCKCGESFNLMFWHELPFCPCAEGKPCKENIHLEREIATHKAQRERRDRGSL